jgi:hypothetical protein
MDMIAHKAIPNQSNIVFPEVFFKQMEINCPILCREKDRLPMIAPLGCMMHPTWNHNTRMP